MGASPTDPLTRVLPLDPAAGRWGNPRLPLQCLLFSPNLSCNTGTWKITDKIAELENDGHENLS